MSDDVPDLTNDHPDLEHAVVTGAKGALGSRVAKTFRRAGCRVTGLDIAVDTDGVAPDPEKDRLNWMELDATDSEAVGWAVERLESEVAPIDALINCAGGFRWSHIEDIDDESLDFLLEANLKSALLLTREVIPGMRERGYGRIVYLSSKSTLSPGAGEGPYTATKAGLNALTKAVAEEVRETDVNVNAVLPSVIDTPANREDMPDADFSQWVQRSELAEIIFRLTQSFGDPINGALMPVAGEM